MKRTTLIVTTLLVAGAAGGYWALRWQPLRVVAEPPSRNTALDAVYATGIVESTLEIKLTPRTAGRLVALEVDEGSVVKRGQVLARLEDADLKSTVDEATAKALYADAQAQRLARLRETGLVSVDALERARADADAARASLRRSREQLSFMTLRAPADGVITRREGEVGDFIAANQALLYLSGTQPLRITADVDEEDLPRIVIGQRALVRIDAYPGRIFEARVAEITPRGDPISRSYRVRLALDKSESLSIGMTAEINVVIAERKNALLIPTTALRDDTVWVMNGEKAAKRSLRLGVKSPDKTEVLSGLSDTDVVISQPPADLSERSRLQRIVKP